MAAVIVSGMSTRWSGASGRYQARCEQGHCALTGDQATSKLQGQIFTLIDYVLGPGRLDVRDFAGRRPVRLDMVFRLTGGQVLVVEYDGAYWHNGQEERDYLKARIVEEAWRDRGCVVVRIREDPLIPLVPYDVQVPADSDAARCTQLVLLHLLHELPASFEDRYGEGRVFSFLRSTSRSLTRSDVRCGTCWKFASHFLPTEVFQFSASSR